MHVDECDPGLGKLSQRVVVNLSPYGRIHDLAGELHAPQQ